MNDKLGYAATDQITGFEGIATGVVTYLTGCVQVLLQPRVKISGEFQETRWFDIDRINWSTGHTKVEVGEMIGSRPVKSAAIAPAGFDAPAPAK